MASTKQQLSRLIEETIRYIEENHSPHERISYSDSPLPVAPIAPVAPAPKPAPMPLPKPAPKVEPPPPKVEVAPEPLPPKAEVVEQKKREPLKEERDLKSVLLELSPALFTEAPIPDDTVAKQHREAWKEKRLAAEVTVLSFDAHGHSHLFLQQVADAIDAQIRPAKVALATLLESENRWSSFFESSALKFVVSFPIPLKQFPHLVAHYKENPQSEHRFLGTTPLVLLRPFNEYLTNPLLKKELWKSLCTQLSS